MDDHVVGSLPYRDASSARIHHAGSDPAAQQPVQVDPVQRVVRRAVPVHTNTTQLQTQVQQLTTAVVAGTATQVALNDARVQLTASQDLEKAIQGRIDQLKLTGQDGPDAQLLTPPYSMPDAVFPQPLIAAGTGALVGLIVAGGVVAMGARRRARP